MTTTGEIIGPYLLGECLGKGGFGAVYEATHQETGAEGGDQVFA